ncbi:MAG: hypothetical protein OQK12_13795 [Motiliproteus sp.]|nr:hypothetical protein [Motiliproteus sp.]MCW9051541.1 hypothetical protein [Motiliproteus sp.]
MNPRSASTPPHPLSPLSISGKFLWFTLVALVLSGLFLYHQFNQSLSAYNQQQLDSIGNSSSAQLSLSSVPMILSDDLLSLNVSVKQLVESPLIEGAEVMSKQGKMLAQSGRPSDQSYDHPVLSNQELLGHVRVYLDTASLQQQQLTYQRRFSLSLFGCLILLISTMWLLTRKLIHQSNQQTTQPNPAPLEENRPEKIGILTSRLLNGQFTDSQNSTNDKPGAEEPEHLNELSATNETELDYDLGIHNDQLTASSPEHAADIARWDLSGEQGVSLENTETEAATQAPPETSEETPCPSGYLLYINHQSNRSDYLTGDERNQLLSIYRGFFQQACELYKGQLQEDEQGNWYAVFSPISQDNSHGINALCAAQLFKGMYRATNQNRIGQLQPVLNIKICLLCGTEQTLKQAQQLSESVASNELISHRPLFETKELATRLLNDGQYKKIGEDCYLLTALCADFQELIDRQVKHFIGA